MAANCRQCRRPISFWERHFAGGLCGRCRQAEDERIRREQEEAARKAAEAAREAAEAEAARKRARTIDDFIFVGLKGYALALDRDTGEIVWSNNQMRSGYVTLLLDGDRLIVSTNGYTYCLHPMTGRILWHNALSGYGAAPTSLTSVRGQSSQTVIQQAAAAEAARRHHPPHAAHPGGH